MIFEQAVLLAQQNRLSASSQVSSPSGLAVQGALPKDPTTKPRPPSKSAPAPEVPVKRMEAPALITHYIDQEDDEDMDLLTEASFQWSDQDS